MRRPVPPDPPSESADRVTPGAAPPPARPPLNSALAPPPLRTRSLVRQLLSPGKFGLGALLLSAVGVLAILLVRSNSEKERAVEAESEARRALEQANQERDRTKEDLERRAGELRQLKEEQAAIKKEFEKELFRALRSEKGRKEQLQRVLDEVWNTAREFDTAQNADNNTVWLHLKLGDIFMHVEPTGLEEATKQCALALSLARQWVQAEPKNPKAQRALAASLERLGDLRQREKKSEEALASYQEALEISRRLVQADPRSAYAQRNLFAYLGRVGTLQLQRGRDEEALVAYLESQEIARKLAEADPRNAAAQRDLIIAYRHLAYHARQTGDFAAAARFYQQGLDVAKRFPTPDAFSDDVRQLQDDLCVCRAAEQPFADLGTARQLPDELRSSVLVAVNKAHARRKELDKALAAADMLADVAQDSGFLLYDAACAYALCAPLAAAEETREKYAARAVDLLRQAIAKGWSNGELLKTDDDLDALRQRDDFRGLLRDLEQKKP